MKENKINKKVVIIIFIAVIISIILVGIFIVNNNKYSTQNDSQLSNNKINEVKTLTQESNNSLGRRFTFDIEQFENTYLKTLETNFSEYKNLLSNGQIDSKFFKPAGAKNYEFNQTAYDEQNQLIKYFTISLEPESTQSNYIDFIQINAVTETSENISEYAENNIFYAFMSVDNSITFEKAKNIYYEMNMSEKNYISNGDVTYSFNIDSSIDCTIIDIFPFNSEQYEEYLKQIESNVDTSEVVENTLSYVIDYNDLDFEPTDKQLAEITDFYNNTNDFNTDTLLDFILQKGWIKVRGNGEIDNTEPTTSQNNTSSSTTKNNNTNSETKKDNNSNKEKENTFKNDFVVNLNINLDELIAKNATAKEIKEKYPTIFIHVYVEDTSEDTETYEYFGGGESIPSNITEKRTLLEGTGYFMGYDTLDLGPYKDRTEKRKVKITMDNTSTMLVQTTLFEGEMVFNKSGTYEIK